MNEILAILYYCFSHETDQDLIDNVEVSTFFCFIQLMGDAVEAFHEPYNNKYSGG